MQEVQPGAQRASLAGRRELGLAAAVLALAAALRIPGLGTQLWLDEVWTLLVLRDLPSAAAVFRDFHHSNNHHLVTLWLQAVGDGDHPVLYRLPSFVAGVAAVLFAGWAGLRGGRLEGLLAATLAGGSSLLVHYASEARGYSLAVCFGLASFLAARRILDGRLASGSAALAGCAVLGFLSQLLYVEPLLAAGVWLAAGLARRGPDAGTAARRIALAFGPSAAIAAAAAFFLVRGMELGAGETYVLSEQLVRALSHAAGGPARGLPALACATAFAAAFALGLRALRRAGRDEWIFHLVAVVLAPAAILLLTRPPTLPIRWFVLPAAFAYLPIARALADALTRGGAARSVAVLALGAFALGNGARTATLWRDGRGDYRAAIRYLAEHDADGAIEIASDQDFRNRSMLQRYAPVLPPGHRIAYRPKLAAQRVWPEWVIVHRYGPEIPQPAELRDPSGRRYALVAEWPASDLSGFRWYLYRAAP